MGRARRGGNVEAAEVVLPGEPLDATLGFFTDLLGFRLDAIWPADQPSTAVISGYGIRIRLDRATAGPPGTLRLSCRDPDTVADGATELTAPNGTLVDLVVVDPPVELPALEPSFVLSRAGDLSTWGDGRAGMRYRDLIPGRQGGRFIASHISIAEGGPVPDYVHFHRVRFQMIYCAKGWARVVYEDQGPPFVLRAGDCVLQPPEIRHRVLESSPGLEVIEVACPAEHQTNADHDLPLPTAHLRPECDFAGQRFVHHVATSATWGPWRLGGFECRDTGIEAATGGLAGVRVVRACGPPEPKTHRHDGELLFVFVLSGQVTLVCHGHPPRPLGEGDSFVVPAGMPHALGECSADLQLLEVTVPALSAFGD